MVTNVVGSKMADFPPIQPANRDNTKTGYGENGYSGPSSDTDLGNPTRSRLSVEFFPNPKVVFADQTRKVGPNVPNAFGMHGPKKS